MGNCIHLQKLLAQELSKEKAEKLSIELFLKDMYRKNERGSQFISYYRQTGGLRKRLYSLSRLAIVLYRLHSRGIVYFDISHNNIFMNSDSIPLIYLIDADYLFGILELPGPKLKILTSYYYHP